MWLLSATLWIFVTQSEMIILVRQPSFVRLLISFASGKNRVDLINGMPLAMNQ